MHEDHEREIARTWDAIWRAKRQGDRGGIRALLGRILLYLETALADSMTLCVERILRNELGTLAGRRILEAGSGTGRISRRLYNEGALVVLVDISQEALELSRTSFRNPDGRVWFVRASILQFPFRPKCMDAVWNAGVLEHFLPHQQRQALDEMARICTPGGKVVTMNPWEGASIYVAAKRRAESRGTWQAGYEVPVRSLDPLGPQLRFGSITKEYSKGFLLQFHYLKYYLPLPKLYLILYELGSRLLSFLNRLPGYFLVTVLETRPISASASPSGNRSDPRA